MVSLWGDHWTCNSPSQSSNQIHVNSNRARYRQTHHATLLMRIIGLPITIDKVSIEHDGLYTRLAGVLIKALATP